AALFACDNTVEFFNQLLETKLPSAEKADIVAPVKRMTVSAGGAVLLVLAALTGLDLNGQPNEEFLKNHAIGESYLRRAKLVEAIPYLEKAQRADPNHYANSWDLALAYLETGNLEAARGLIVQMLVQKNTAELHNLLADLEE